MPAASLPRPPGAASRRLAVVLATAGIGAAWMAVTGPLPLMVWTRVLPETVPWGYTFLAFPLLGMGVADTLDLARARRWRGVALLGLEVALAVAAGEARLALDVPISGHATLAAWLLARRLLVARPSAPWDRIEPVAAGAGLVVVAAFKLLAWHDPGTLLLGVLLGLVLALPSRLAGGAPAAVPG